MSESKLRGSCLCGSVSYTVSGKAERFYHCHCSRCRKASGTGHCSNVLATDARVTWGGDEALVTRYRHPEAERFMTTFCARCGGPLPRYVEHMNLAVIPAGSLDESPPLAPQARIFVDSSAPWSCDTRELPAFAEYPA